MKHTILLAIVCGALTLSACSNSQKQLQKRAAELCAYIPDHQLLERSQDYLTPDFYALLDTMFNHLPEHEAMDHEWLYYFVTGNGGTIANYTVTTVERIDPTHAVATVLVRQVWEDGSFDETTDLEEHQLYMERVGKKWLMSDFDGHKADCINYIANNRREQALRDAISDYLIREIGCQYLQGEICIPTLMMVAEEDSVIYGDFWIMWYNLAGDTLKFVSGGNHSGKMTIAESNGTFVVTAFEQTLDGAANEPSAKRIFGTHYDIYHSMHSNESVREAVWQEQLSEYIRRHNLSARYYQDYQTTISIER